MKNSRILPLLLIPILLTSVAEAGEGPKRSSRSPVKRTTPRVLRFAHSFKHAARTHRSLRRARRHARRAERRGSPYASVFRKKYLARRELDHRGAVKVLKRSVRRSNPVQFAHGLLVDGPRHTRDSLRKNRKVFLLGVGALAVTTLAANQAGLSHELHTGLVATSALLGVKEAISIARTKVIPARSRAQRARSAGEMLWPAAVVAGTAAVGGALNTSAHGASGASHAPKLLTGAKSMFSGVVTGGDAPVLGVQSLSRGK